VGSKQQKLTDYVLKVYDNGSI